MRIRFEPKFLLFFVALMLVKACWAHEASLYSESPKFSYCSEQHSINSLAEALKCSYSEQALSAALKFSRETKWVRIDAPNPSETKAFVIKLEPFLLHQIDVYYQVGEDWKRITTGASQPINPDLTTIAGYRILVPAAPSKTSTYYLAITSPSLSFASISIDPWTNKAGALKQNQNVGFGLQLGMLIAIFGFALVSYLLNRSIVMKRFTLFSADLLLCLLVGSGLVMQTLLPNHPWINEVLFHSVLCLRMAFWVGVVQALLSSYKTPSWYPKSCKIIYGLVGLEIALYVGLGFTFFSSLVGTLLFVAPIIQIYAVNKTDDIPKPFSNILTGGFLLIIGLFLLMIGSLALFPEPNSRAPLYIARLTDFTMPLVLLGIVTFRNRLVHGELEEVKLALNEATIRAEYEKKLLTERQTLIDMFAHELKNPLTSISLAVHGLADNADANISGAKRRITNINRSIKDMDEIIERCNLMNSLDNKKIVLEKNVINLKKFIRQILASLDAENMVMLNVASNIELSTDAKFLRVIFTNLIQNALKYSVPNSKIKIIAKQVPGHVAIEFLNEVNPSMLPDEASVFTRFYRHPLAHEHRGAGLGLFLTKEMCKLIDGQISYSQRQGVVNFTVEIPS